MTGTTLDVIPLASARTLAGLFRERAKRTPEAVAYAYFDPHAHKWRSHTWAGMKTEVARWQAAFENEGLARGARVAVMLKNCCEWVCCEQAALGLGLVVVPLFYNDRAENVAYVLGDCGAEWLLIGGADTWQTLAPVAERLGTVKSIVTVQPVAAADSRVRALTHWLPASGGGLRAREAGPEDLATIVYTSGTTGNPKGVMLSHHNILSNTWACTQAVTVYREDVFLSFLPLSHMYERTVGYFLPMMAGAQVTYARSVPQLADDLLTVRPTILICVPRIFERIHMRLKEKLDSGPAFKRRLFERAVTVGWARFEHQQGRTQEVPGTWQWPLLKALVANKVMARLGGRLRLAMSGGAPLSPDVARVFIGLGLPVLQGYGLTETSPVISTNRLNNNQPASVGPPIPGVRVRTSDEGELLVRSPGVTPGYWNMPEATAALIDEQGWLHTGDLARLDQAGRIYITGRMKDILVLANGEKVPPADMEAAVKRDVLFEQVMVLGEGKPYLSALVVLNAERWPAVAEELGLAPDTRSLQSSKLHHYLVKRIGAQLSTFPGYAQVRRVCVMLKPWTVENGLVTPTLKERRARILEQFQKEIDQLYEGH
ncbi:MAG TPA: long-chain fatty acid--CoA ligase [Gammaproteobacteria bacterium]|nr:long-chain fatty acid--CoA ligase [Gammaproteobacteria bacterium]